MGQLKVDFQELRSAQRVMAETHHRVDELLSSLSTQVNALTQEWEGAASDGFQRTVREWHAAAADLQDRLVELHNMVGNAHDNHATVVRSNTAIWRG
jgi:WXG100 family type VII secretion target